MEPLTNQPGWGIIQVQRVPPADGSPSVVERSNRYFRKRRLLLFAFCICENSNNEHTELNQVRPCNNHICHPLSVKIGGKKEALTPDGKRRGGTACRGAGGTVDSIAQLLTKCKKKETAIPLLKEFLDNTENSLEEDIRCPQFSPPGNRTVDKPAGVGYNTSTKGAVSRRLPWIG